MSRYGYGILTKGRKTTLSAHRVSWEICFGPVQNGLHVLHKCDTPACVNPEHLFLGTQQDNMRDRNVKGRTAKGEQRPEAILSADDVRRIRLDSRSNAVIAREVNVDPSTISHIKRRRIWKHVK